jgi:Rps23 Pro-64 3,4-dihydroxylase Tpa1-like proline 4-hydroxylase
VSTPTLLHTADVEIPPGAGLFDLDDSLELGELSAEFARSGRIQILRVLRPDSALLLSELLAAERHWGLSLAAGSIGRRFLQIDARQRLSGQQVREIFEAAYGDAGRSRSHLYETLSLTNYHSASSHAAMLYAQLLQFMGSARFLGFVRAVSGFTEIRSTTAVACRYSAGHFYASHIDEIGGAGHRASFVLNLSQEWQPQWGGILQFKGAQGDVEDAYLPRFNSLSLFVASQAHAVSIVSPYAPRPRHSIAGALIS